MRFEASPFTETPDASRIKRLADSAEQWAESLDLSRYPSIHISKALQGIPNGRERDLLFGAIRRELNKRASMQRTSRDDEAVLDKEVETIRREEQRQRTMREAYAHQMRQPREAWDPNAD